MSAQDSPPPPHNQSPGCSNSLGIPDNPFARPRMLLNMDLIESSSDSDDAETLDSYSELDSSDENDPDIASSSSELENDDSGQCSDSGNGDESTENDYDRIFNKGVSTSSDENSEGEETDDSNEKQLNANTGTALLHTTRLTPTKRQHNDHDPTSDLQAKTRKL
ncbi:hypothetical protein M3Y97_00905800 [Aphelenchoides bicaudatus]|nr:hypothetical protein M3Y97_00905800 [Aphelenchoides bicaudatus]